MVGYMSLEEQVDADFSRARRRALLRQVRTRLRRDNASEWLLLCFDDLGKIPWASARVYRGTRTVPLSQIEAASAVVLSSMETLCLLRRAQKVGGSA
jgi:hypothetical protein